MDLRTKAFFIGMLGDFTLQQIVKYQGNFAGLRDYFKQHGVLESLFIAGGMMFFFTYLYEQTGLPLTVSYLFIYGMFLDFMFRTFNLMPSLEHTYYGALTWFQSLLWGALPMLMILI